MVNLSSVLDIALSLVFVYLTLSLFVSGIVEFINAFIGKRSQLFRFALEELLGGAMFQQFWTHELTKIKEQKIAGFLKPVSCLSADRHETLNIEQP